MNDLVQKLYKAHKNTLELIFEAQKLTTLDFGLLEDTRYTSLYKEAAKHIKELDSQLEKVKKLTRYDFNHTMVLLDVEFVRADKLDRVLNL